MYVRFKHCARSMIVLSFVLLPTVAFADSDPSYNPSIDSKCFAAVNAADEQNITLFCGKAAEQFSEISDRRTGALRDKYLEAEADELGFAAHANYDLGLRRKAYAQMRSVLRLLVDVQSRRPTSTRAKNIAHAKKLISE
jgi:hypothetical protein